MTYLKTDQKLETGEDVYLFEHPNGETEYCIKGVDATGREYYKRLPKHVFDLHKGNSEIVSDVSLVLDADLSYPTMQEQILRFERGGLMLNGTYDDDEDFTDIENDLGEPISPYEVRTQEAYERLAELRKQISEKRDEKVKEAVEDEKRLEQEALKNKADEKSA